MTITGENQCGTCLRYQRKKPERWKGSEKTRSLRYHGHCTTRQVFVHANQVAPECYE